MVPLRFMLNAIMRHGINRMCLPFVLYSKKNILLAPNYFMVRLTRKCNAQCVQCDSWKTQQHNDLSLTKWKEILLDIRRTLGPYCVRFYGGEPFIFSGFLDLLFFCKRHAIATQITTNGTCIDEKMAIALKKARVMGITFSMDGMRAGTHDKLRGMQGMHTKIVKAIESVHDQIPVIINTVVMKDNIDELKDLALYAKEKKIKIAFQGVNAAYKENAHHLEEYQSLVPTDKDRIKNVFDSLISFKKQYGCIINSVCHLRQIEKSFAAVEKGAVKKHCPALGFQLLIKENGDLFVCGYAGKGVGSIGNVAEKNFRTIWNLPYARGRRNAMLYCNEQSCLNVRGCNKESYIEKIKQCINL